jgi:hypothetical protein
MNGHNDKFRTVIRRVLRDGIGLRQERAQVWAQKADYWVHRAAIESVCKAVWTGVGTSLTLCGAATIAIDPQGTYRTARYYYFSKEGIKDTLKRKTFKFLREKMKNSPKWGDKFPEHG